MVDRVTSVFLFSFVLLFIGFSIHKTDKRLERIEAALSTPTQCEFPRIGDKELLPMKGVK